MLLGARLALGHIDFPCTTDPTFCDLIGQVKTRLDCLLSLSSPALYPIGCSLASHDMID
jgi:hypothetical protein